NLVESRCGAVSLGRTYLFPPPSSGGALVVRPWLRFHIPLIEPDVQISRIRLSDNSLPRKGCRVGLRIVLFEICSGFTFVAACTLALSPIRDTHSEGFSYFVTSIAAPAASGWSVRRVGLAPTGKRRLVTAHTRSRHRRPTWQVRTKVLLDRADVVASPHRPIGSS